MDLWIWQFCLRKIRTKANLAFFLVVEEKCYRRVERLKQKKNENEFHWKLIRNSSIGKKGKSIFLLCVRNIKWIRCFRHFINEFFSRPLFMSLLHWLRIWISIEYAMSIDEIRNVHWILFPSTLLHKLDQWSTFTHRSNSQYDIRRILCRYNGMASATYNVADDTMSSLLLPLLPHVRQCVFT